MASQDRPHKEETALLNALDRSMAIIEFSPEGVILRANKNYLNISGYTEEELLHRHHRIFCTAEYAVSKEYDQFWRTLRQGRFLSGSFCRRRRDGRLFWAEASYNPVFGPDGTLVKVVKLASDVTARVEEANERGSKLAAISRAMLTAEFAPDGTILTVNDNLLACFGYSREALTGSHHRMLCEPEYAASAAYADFWKQLRAGNFISGQAQRRAEDGSTVWLEASYSPVFDLTGKIQKIVKFSSDITRRVEHEQEEHREIEHLSRVIDAAGCAILLLDSHCRVERVNAGFVRIYGYRPEEMRGKIPHPLFGPLSDRDFIGPLRTALRAGEAFNVEGLTYGKTGQRFWSAVSVTPLRDDAGKIFGAGCMLTDITATKLHQLLQQKVLEAVSRELSVSEVMALMCREMEEAAPELTVSIHGVDAKSRLHLLAAPGLSERFAEILRDCEAGPDAGSWGLAASTGDNAVVPDISDAPCWREQAKALLAEGLRACCSMPVISASGRTVGVVTLYYKDAREPDSFHLRMLEALSPLCALAFDREETRLAVRRLSFYDAATGLPNRELLLAKMDMLLSRRTEANQSTAVLCLSLDAFKRVAETLSHDATNALLRMVGECLEKKCEARGLVGRLADDEFILVLPDCDAEKAGAVTRRLQHALADACRMDGVVLKPTACAGVSLFPDNGQDSETLLRHASLAARQARRLGRGQLSFYSENMNKALRERVSMESCLRDSLLGRELRLCYQPQVDMRHGGLHGFEALSRWRHPEFGDVPPDRFIPLAEECGLIGDLSRLVLEEVCIRLGGWRRSGLAVPCVSLNLSPSDFHNRDLPERILNILTAQHLRPEDLVLEITEGILLDSNSATLETVAAVRRAGLRLSMDDFGTGYSSLSYLRRLPVTELKLDKSFVQDVHTDATSRSLSEAVIRIGESLGLTVVAEGVENEEQLAVLAGQGYHVAQGYLHAKPLPGDEAAAWVRARTGEAG